MIFNQTEHTIDLGEVGFRHSKQLFRVHLEASKLVELIGHANSIYRVYELMLVERAWRRLGVCRGHYRSRAVRRGGAGQLRPRKSSTAPWR
jgi:hypothetical protein